MQGEFGQQPHGQMYGSMPDYEAQLKSPFARGQRSTITLPHIGVGIFLPWIVFTVVYWSMSFSMHYNQLGLVYALCGLLGVAVFVIAFLAFNSWRRSSSNTSWLVFLFTSSFIAWSVGFIGGDQNFQTNMYPYLDIQNLATYPSVDPTQYRGQQLMDAGQIHFVQGAHLDLTKSMGFKNLETYCVAPITITSNSSAQNAIPYYDFWAVGVNCCSGHAPDFHCGEYNNPKASAGLRLMRDDQRAFFRLAVQQAEAAYNLKAGHPVFLYWLQDPSTEINAYQDDGYKYFLLGLSCFLAYQVFAVVIATLIITKTGL